MKKLILFVICSFVICHSFAYAKEYDGIWFLGFNMSKPLFSDSSGKVVRQAVTIAIDRDKIVKKIISDEAVPTGIIPPSMEGYDPTLQPYPHDYGQAKKMMRSAGYPVYDKRLKAITLLQTGGLKTKDIVDEIKIDLINLGFDIQTTEIPYSNTAQWQKELSSGKYDLFVMGYKAGNLGQIFVADKSTRLFHAFNCFNNTTNEADIAYFNKYYEAVEAGFSPDPVCDPKPEASPKTIALLQPLFYSEGTANFTHFHNKRIDVLLENLSDMDESLKASRQEKFDEITHILWEECPVVPLFYITRL
jgi:ABC-type transport system substrate-binding protein